MYVATRDQMDFLVRQSKMKSGFLSLVVALAIAMGCSQMKAQTAVLTRSYNNGRTGANTTETELTPAQIESRGLTRIHSLLLTGDDPRIEAQPLYFPGIQMSDGQKHDVLFVFSMSNNIWAFDANTGAPIWPSPIFLGPPFLPAPGDPVDSAGINKSFGILSTPVIDPDTKVLYVVNWLSDAATHSTRLFQLHALRLSDGQEVPGKPPLGFTSTFINAAGQAITFNQVQKQRAALLLAPAPNSLHGASGKRLYVAITGSEDPPANGDPATVNHGWVFAFDVDAWQQSSAWVSTPSSFGGGIWQGSQGPAADANGNVYFMTANGGYILAPQEKDFNGITDYSECFVRLREQGGTLSAMDWFSPFRDAKRHKFGMGDVGPNSPSYDYTDQDLGSAGAVLIPDSRLIIGVGKDGVLYVLDRYSMGKNIGDPSKLYEPPIFFTYDPDTHLPAYANARPDGNLDFEPLPGMKSHHMHGTPVYWYSDQLGGLLYGWGENGPLRAFTFDGNGHVKLVAQGREVASALLADPATPGVGGMPGGMITLSSNGGKNGVVWATAPLDGDANKFPVAGAVRAYDATAFDSLPAGVPRMRLLWEATGFTFSKFCVPIVADGKVFVPTYDGRVDEYVLK
jgi:outer membrane protein assembly factor BamB